ITFLRRMLTVRFLSYLLSSFYLSDISIISLRLPSSLFFFFNVPASSEIYTLSLHDALPISAHRRFPGGAARVPRHRLRRRHRTRSEEHTSELQSRFDLVCRLLLEKKKQQIGNNTRRVAN